MTFISHDFVPKIADVCNFNILAGVWAIPKGKFEYTLFLLPKNSSAPSLSDLGALPYISLTVKFVTILNYGARSVSNVVAFYILCHFNLLHPPCLAIHTETNI